MALMQDCLAIIGGGNVATAKQYGGGNKNTVQIVTQRMLQIRRREGQSVATNREQFGYSDKMCIAFIANIII